MRGNYKTKSKDIIDNEIKNFSNGFTIKELKESFDSKNIQIGLTTIYRHLDELEDEEVVKKYYDDKNIAHYKFVLDCTSDNHFYLKCIKCDKIIHVDCECINEFYAHVLKQHKFELDCKNIILPGICNDCKSFIKL